MHIAVKVCSCIFGQMKADWTAAQMPCTGFLALLFSVSGQLMACSIASHWVDLAHPPPTAPTVASGFY